MHICIIVKGIGFASLLLVFFGNVYYQVILAWSLRYLYDSFSFDLPWKYCSNQWNTECCCEKLLHGSSSSNPTSNDSLIITTESAVIADYNRSELVIDSKAACAKMIDPITEYWE